MPNHQSHRGPHPEDGALFTEVWISTLRTALEEASFLLGRGYSTDSVLDVVSRRHELRSRQRTALQRCMCSPQQQRSRHERRASTRSLQGGQIEIDGFNQVISLEVALSGGLLIRGSDGALRDLAGLRGSYRLVEETDQALLLFGRVFDALRISAARWYLDSPVSNSGRLKQRILAHSVAWKCEVTVELVQNPDRELYAKELVATSDAAILDHAPSWFGLTEYVLEHHIANAWVVDLAPVQGV